MPNVGTPPLLRYCATTLSSWNDLWHIEWKEPAQGPAVAGVRVPEGGARRQVKPAACRPGVPTWHPAQERRGHRSGGVPRELPTQRLQGEKRGEGTIGPTRPRTHRGHLPGQWWAFPSTGGLRHRRTRGATHREAQKPGSVGRPRRRGRVSGTRGGTTKAQPIQARRLEKAGLGRWRMRAR